MRTYLEIARNLLWSVLLAFLLCWQLTSYVQSDPITKIIDWNQAKDDWCGQRYAAEGKVFDCVFSSQ